MSHCRDAREEGLEPQASHAPVSACGHTEKQGAPLRLWFYRGGVRANHQPQRTPRQVRETLRMICAASQGCFSAFPTVGPQKPWAGARSLASSAAALPTTPCVTLSKSLPSPSSFYLKNRGNGDWTTMPAFLRTILALTLGLPSKTCTTSFMGLVNGGNSLSGKCSLCQFRC